MTTAGEMAAYTTETTYDDVPEHVRDRIKRRLLDSVGIAIGALGHEPVEIVRDTVEELNQDGECTIWATDRGVSPPDAAMMNTALVRYLDYMDSYLAPGETPHPSDNIAAVVACGEYEDRSGADLVTGIGIAYEIQGALAWNAPVRDRGWDHVTHTIFSATAGAAKLLDLSLEETENALGIAGTAHNALRVTRTGKLSMWKGIASANTARNAVYSAILAKNGMEGPKAVLEGQKGWQQVVSGEFDASFSPTCERVERVMAKRYVAETYAQSAVEGLLELVAREEIDPVDIEHIELDTFAGAKLIIGGGEGDRYAVEEKSQADHSLPYMLAVAVLDGQLLNEQYEPERIRRDDVQSLLRKVDVYEEPELTERFEAGEMPAVLRVEAGGETYRIEKSDFRGHPNNPMSWDELEEKFAAMTRDRYDEERRAEVVDVVRNIEGHDVADLVAVLR